MLRMMRSLMSSVIRMCHRCTRRPVWAAILLLFKLKWVTLRSASLVGCCQNCYATPSLTCRMHSVPPANGQEGVRSLKSLSCRVPQPDQPHTHKRRLVCKRALMRIYTEFLIIPGDRPIMHTQPHTLRLWLLSSHGGSTVLLIQWVRETETTRGVLGRSNWAGKAASVCTKHTHLQ